MSTVRFEGIARHFGPVRALLPTDLDIPQGEFLTLLGPSGSGKTTLLNICAGYLEPSAGRLIVDGRDVTAAPPRLRNMGMVFQNYALFPHMTVAENVAYGLKVRRRPGPEIKDRVARALDIVSLGPLGDRYPAQLSGGQQQRVAIARVLVLEPDVLLLDEPFNALDAKLRLSMQTELRKLIERLGITSIFVTHDQSEAMMLSDQVAVMRAGTFEQVAPPLAIYDRPANPFVATFIGRANILPVGLRAGAVVDFPAVVAERPDGPADLIVRPENLTLAAGRIDPGTGQSGPPGTVLFAIAQGPTIEYEVDAGFPEPLRVTVNRRSGEVPLAAGSPVSIGVIDPAACRVIERGTP
ncbi:Fe3+/spermidine/putrescine ABC transporter ATP-binding protein [Prosthecomicrobium hirschii]|uniref:ABC transporter ATP-binding protein n=1 Tax=Prosthecodimorpha hirschii TaxID=665126 RepID=UPI001129ECCF|nr:ABC transporter ATP-binding protein [Prosthecomicrobium hirschii]TPQ49027.1 Fe3+/spermidine/putrescine ABC transporter ATP-binding protein [Prosthecomicrobium hirschii]